MDYRLLNTNHNNKEVRIMAISDEQQGYYNTYWHQNKHQLLQSNWSLPAMPTPKDDEWQYHCCVPNGPTVAVFDNVLVAALYLQEQPGLVMVCYRHDDQARDRARDLKREQGRHWLCES